MKKNIFLLLLCLTASFPLLAEDITLTLDAKGVLINAGALGSFVLSMPVLVTESPETKEVPVFESSVNKGIAKYPSGAKLDVEITSNTLVCTYSSLPANAKALKLGMVIPIKFKNGGKYGFNSDPLKEFPTEKGQKPSFEQGSALRKFTLVDPMGSGFSIDAQSNWGQLQDNRFFNNSQSFQYIFIYDLKANPGKNSFTIKIDPYTEAK
jgi:hypothetical protein